MRLLHNGKALIITDEKIDATVFHMYPDVKVIGCNMTGLNHIDLGECAKRGIKIISMQGEFEFLKKVTSTAEHTMGLIIALLRNYKTALNEPYQERDSYMGHKLSGKKALLIGGLGRVGIQVQRVLEAFGVDVTTQDKYKDYNWLLKFLDWLFPSGLSLQEELYATLHHFDIVSIHIPLSGNIGFFTKEMFEQMKNNAIFINTSRSSVVEKGALLYALENKLIAGAAVDFTDEPELVDYAATHQNLVLTNHIGGVTSEDRKLTMNFIEQKVDDYINKLIRKELHED